MVERHRSALVKRYRKHPQTCIRKRRDSFKDQGCSTIQQWTICQIRVASNPTAVCSAKVYISRVIVKDVLESSSSIHHVPSGTVKHTLGLP